jgi:uncharacterized membrane protein
MIIIEYLGKFHPLAVHLPIGILCLFIVLVIFIPRRELFKSYYLLRITVLLSAISATVATVSGYILRNSEDYAGDLVSAHQVSGIALTIACWVIYVFFRYVFKASPTLFRFMIFVVALLMILTGHFGGSLTHGADFLEPPPLSTWFSDAGTKPIISLNSTGFEAVQIVFNEKCVVCHGANKQKGGLRLDTREMIVAGGEHGSLIAGQEGESLLLTRIHLPLDDDEHMPPAERKQLKQAEIDFISWWVQQGADFESTLAELQLPDSLNEILTSEEPPDPLIPPVAVQRAEPEVVRQLTSLGVIITPLSANSNYLVANFVNVLPDDLQLAMEGLTGIREQLTVLYLDYQTLDPSSWEVLGQLTGLRKLSLRHTNLDNEKLLTLSNLDEMVSLNIVDTEISSEGIASLDNMPNLKKLYLYQTAVKSSELQEIVQNLPNTTIDTGNYQVPILPSDTTVLTSQKQ